MKEQNEKDTNIIWAKKLHYHESEAEWKKLKLELCDLNQSQTYNINQ